MNPKNHQVPTSPLGTNLTHESGALHVTGKARYVDDLPAPRGMLTGWVVASPVARGKLHPMDTQAAKAVPGVKAVIVASDIPGINDISPFSHDEPLLAVDEVFCVGQAIALIVAETADQCREAAKQLDLKIDPKPAILGAREAVAANSFLTQPHRIRRGDAEKAMASATHVLEGEVETPGQDHFYLETQASLAIPGERGALEVISSTQHPSEIQAKIAEVLNLGRHEVSVKAVRMGGAFGGKESQAAPFAALAALGASITKRPVKVWLNRDQDMVQTGKRHPFYAKYRAGFDASGVIQGLVVDVYADGGWSMDLSPGVLDRCLFHLDNAYFIPNVALMGQVAKTNVASNTAFRGFGGPQGVLIIEAIMNRAAAALGLDPAVVRQRNFYDEATGRNTTPYGQTVTECRLARIFDELMATSEYRKRREEVAEFNRTHRFARRGIAFQPVKFGISFTKAMLNQAGALVHIYTDGSVQVNHGGTEMGQGLHTKMAAVAAHNLGVNYEAVRVMDTATDKVPNTSPTAASSGADLNGQAVKQACDTLRGRLAPVAATLLGCTPEQVQFAEGYAKVNGGDKAVAFRDVAQKAWELQVSLSSTGYYATPGILYDYALGKGKPFHYYAYGAAVVEVEVNGLTGEHKLVRVDVLHDVGASLAPAIDKGQVEGAFIQGYGWLTCEELLWDGQGRLRTHSPDTYKIPSFGQTPMHFDVRLLQNAPQDTVIHGSKAVGEPPLVLAVGAVSALGEAVRAFGQQGLAGSFPELKLPCTPESILHAIERVRSEIPTEKEMGKGDKSANRPKEVLQV